MGEGENYRRERKNRYSSQDLFLKVTQVGSQDFSTVHHVSTQPVSRKSRRNPDSAWWSSPRWPLGQVGPRPGGPSACWSLARWDLGLVGPQPGGPRPGGTSAWWDLGQVGPRPGGPWPGGPSVWWALGMLVLGQVRPRPGGPSTTTFPV